MTKENNIFQIQEETTMVSDENKVLIEGSPVESQEPDQQKNIPEVTIEDLINFNVLVGHPKSNESPAMKKENYIAGYSGDFSIFDGNITREKLIRVCEFLAQEVERRGSSILFVAPKKSVGMLQQHISHLAKETGQFYMVQSWINGFITNFSVVQTSVKNVEVKKYRLENDPSLLKKEKAIMNRYVQSRTEELEGVVKLNYLPSILVSFGHGECVLEAAKTAKSSRNITPVFFADSNTEQRILDAVDPEKLVPVNCASSKSIEYITKILEKYIKPAYEKYLAKNHKKEDQTQIWKRKFGEERETPRFNRNPIRKTRFFQPNRGNRTQNQ